MLDYELEKLHKCHLLLADELKRICDAGSIPYFMVAGTLLGAVRHQGFIPWDDDMDFGMLRDDFERFCHIAPLLLNTEVFCLQTSNTEENYPFNFVKMRLVGTFVEESYGKGILSEQGIYIDIFPFDDVPDDLADRRRMYRNYYIIRNILLLKCGFPAGARKAILKVFGKLASMMMSREFLKRKKTEILKAGTYVDSACLVAADGFYGLDKETIQRTWIEKIEVYRFEDREFPGPANYDDYLKHMYGDYMSFPSESERNHHDRLHVDFGRYGEL
ncbi:LicD family protein [Alistipes putredinis]|uniref:LicD family protein n=1 Tax=Alistipes putredinis TaxID=28117 RepID=UPI003A87EB28